MDQDRLIQAREKLTSLTPLQTNCGQLCDAACCQPDEDGQGGVLLFPGEDALLKGTRWGHIVYTEQGAMLVCDHMCERSERPLGCRIFPLTPKKRRDGSYGVRIDRRAFAMCPLAQSGTKGLHPLFVQAACGAIQLIASDAQGAQFLDAWIKQERQFAQPLF
ncbi:hypothetical protein LJC33_01585 [Eubacteriales bacterium OttesenSCG-928-N13]|nr:hypothetical protein [Eubacteriales bacterium OttesenSCG-928-N13]